MRGSIEDMWNTGNKGPGSRWRVRWDLPEGPGGKRRQRSKRFTTRVEAEKHLRHVLTEQDRGRPVERSTETVEQAAEAYLTSKAAAGKAKTTLDLWGTCLRVHVVPRIGHLKVSAVTVRHVEGLYADLALHGKAARLDGGQVCRTAGVTCSANGCEPTNHEGLGPAMARQVHRQLRAVLKRSLPEGAVLPTDSDRARDALPSLGPTRVDPSDYWSDDQARAFIAHAVEDDDTLAPVWSVALATGLRRSELAGLRWSDLTLDGDDPHLWVRQSITEVRGRPVVKDGGKTSAAVRKVPLGSVSVEVLREHRRQQAADALAADPETWTDSGHVFTSPDGSPLNPARLTRRFSIAAQSADLPAVGLHGARHYAITAMLRAGVPVTTVAKIVGHENPSITHDIYSHAIPDDDRRAAEAMDQALGPVPATA